MSMINYKDPFFIQWNIDDNGNKVSVEILNEQKQVIGNILVLSQLPDIQYRVFIDETFVEIDIKDEITQVNQYKVDYTHGYIVTHPSLNGQTLNIKRYYGRGVILTHVSRIFTKVEGDVAETLASIIEDGTDALTAYGGIVKAINDAETKKQALDGSISTGTNLNAELESNILTGSQLKTDLQNDISQGIIVKNELEQAITNGDIDTINNNITDLAGVGRTTETVKSNSDKIGNLTEKVDPETPLNTTSQNLSGAVNEIYAQMVELDTKVETHKADYAKEATQFTIESDDIYERVNCNYYKKNGFVFLNLADIQKKDASAFELGAYIARLPVGFRPKRTFYVQGMAQTGSTRSPISLIVYSSGEVQMGQTSSAIFIRLAVSYYAGGGTV